MKGLSCLSIGKWKMENGDTAIVNDCCQKVACTFCGQIWNVWYTGVQIVSCLHKPYYLR